MRRPRALAPSVVALGLGLALVACSSDSTPADAIAVTAANTTCTVAQTQLSAGKHSFQVSNTGSQATEVYVYAPGDKVVAEKENIGPGTKATFSVTLAAGTYDVACKPGQTGNGIRQALTVT
ncbi:MAG TPA: cupredoxin domain-containing protein [Acidimicrobiales bacterium]|nr:cupredoxin domain-containing protein [Acidimicrobiales bacterium]